MGDEFTAIPPSPRWLPKYVFVLSLENRSFDHLFGRSNIGGKDAEHPGSERAVNGVLGKDGKINQELKNFYNGNWYTIPDDDPPDSMPNDPKHEYEHVLCQVSGPKAVQDLIKNFRAAPAKMTYTDVQPTPASPDAS